MPDTRYSRSGNTNGMGKCSEEVKTHVPEDVKNALVTLATVNGMTLSEYTRSVLQDHAFGRLHTVRLAIPFNMGRDIMGTEKEQPE